MLLAAASCQQLAPEKAEVEAGFAVINTANLPTPSITATKVSGDNRSIDVTLSFTGGDLDDESVVTGLLYGVDPTFQTATYVEVVNGTVTLKTTPGCVNYYKAVVSNGSQSSYSEVVVVDVPDIPWYYKISDTYFGTRVSDYDGEEYEHVLTLIIEDIEQDVPTVLVANIDAFFAKNGYTYELGLKYDMLLNTVVGTIDKKARTINIPTNEGDFDSGMYEATGDYLSYAMTATDTPDVVVLTFSEDASQLDFPYYVGSYTTQQGGNFEITLPSVYQAN